MWHRVQLGLILLAATLCGAQAMAIEIPEYKVLVNEGSFEVREYSPYLLAETEVDSGFMNAGNVAFGRLFRYISGANTTQAKIAMTAPVEQSTAGSEKIAMTAPVEQSREGDVFRVGFVVPRKYDLDTVPQPTDPRVKIRVVDARKVAVWRYAGRWTEENFRENESLLRARMAEKGLQPVAGDSAIIARYDAPFMPWFLRRNEVLIPLRASVTLQ